MADQGDDSGPLPGASEELAGDMHIHKPKVLHGVREVLGEIGIIVVGIVIALALEQTVEWIHWSEQTRRTEAALQAELKTNFGFAYERRVIEGCLNDRIVVLRGKLLEPGPHWSAIASEDRASGFYPAPAMPAVFRVPFRPRPTEAWQTALSSGVLNHMAPERVAIYARIYDQIALLRQTQEAETTALHSVGGLAFDRELSASDRTAYLDRLETIASLDRTMAGESGQLIHAPFAFGTDAFHLTQADTSRILAAQRAARGSCVTPERTPAPSDVLPSDVLSSVWFRAR